jgi:cytochrome c oxidase subunit 4
MPSARTYLSSGAALLLLLGMTVCAAYIGLGPLNTLLAMSISTGKAVLILIFFMNLRNSRPLIWVCAAAGFFWLGIMIALALNDYMTRGWR